MKVTWAVICEGSSIDQESNNISLFNLLDQLLLPEPPDEMAESNRPVMAAVRLLLVAMFSRSDSDQGETATGRIAIHFPDDIEPQFLPVFEIDLESAHRLRGKFNLVGIPVSGEGLYHFQIQILGDDGNWDFAYEVPVEVSYLEPE